MRNKFVDLRKINQKKVKFHEKKDHFFLYLLLPKFPNKISLLVWLLNYFTLC